MNPHPDPPTCYRCGDSVLVGDGSRFEFFARDQTDGSLSVHDGPLCSACWQDLVDFLAGRRCVST